MLLVGSRRTLHARRVEQPADDLDDRVPTADVPAEHPYKQAILYLIEHPSGAAIPRCGHSDRGAGQ